MQVRSPELFTRLEKLAAHYNANVASQYVKGEFPNLTLSRRDWDEIELLTARLELFRHQGFHLDELYLKLLALARFIKQCRTVWGPGLKGIIARRYASRPAGEKLMAEMVAANFPANLKVLAELTLELFYMVRKEDGDQNQGRLAALGSVPEAKEIETLLQG